MNPEVTTAVVVEGSAKFLLYSFEEVDFSPNCIHYDVYYDSSQSLQLMRKETRYTKWTI